MLAARGLVFPPINELLRWQDIFPTFNKIALIACLAALLGIGLFLLASRADPMVAPTGPRNLAEQTIEFVEEGIVMQTLGKEGLKWTPFLLSLFIFIFLCNIPGILPFFQMPATARIAIPLTLALLVWVVYIAVGLKHQGAAYFGHLLWPPGVPDGAQAARRRDRVHLDHHRHAVQPHRPTHGEHARRAHPAGHVRTADRTRWPLPRPARGCSCRPASCRSSCSSS